MIDADAVDNEEERLRQEVRLLNEQGRLHFYREFERQVKDPDTYAVLNYLFISGLHHFYLQRWLRGAVNLALFIMAVIMMVGGLLWYGIGLLAAVTLVELYALFRAQVIVQHYNNRIMRRLLDEIPH